MVALQGLASTQRAGPHITQVRKFLALPLARPRPMPLFLFQKMKLQGEPPIASIVSDHGKVVEIIKNVPTSGGDLGGGACRLSNKKRALVFSS